MSERTADDDGVEQGNLLKEGPRAKRSSTRVSDIEAVIELYPVVRDALDSDRSSVYMDAIWNSLEQYVRESQALLNEHDSYLIRARDGDLSAEETKKVLEAFGRLDGWARSLKQALHCLRGCHETMGLTPNELAELAQRYGFDDQIPSWDLVNQIQEKALMAKIRSDKALSRAPRVSDERVLTVLKNVKGRSKQAKTLHLTERQLYRRIEQLRESGKLEA